MCQSWKNSFPPLSFTIFQENARGGESIRVSPRRVIAAFFWMCLFMASMAQADKIAVCKSQFRIFFIGLDMVDCSCRCTPAVSLASDTPVLVTPQDVFSFLFPFSRIVKIRHDTTYPFIVEKRFQAETLFAGEIQNASQTLWVQRQESNLLP